VVGGVEAHEMSSSSHTHSAGEHTTLSSITHTCMVCGALKRVGAVCAVVCRLKMPNNSVFGLFNPVCCAVLLACAAQAGKAAVGAAGAEAGAEQMGAAGVATSPTMRRSRRP
jgi:hypothetical protein